MIETPPDIVVTARALPPARSDDVLGVVVIDRDRLDRAGASGLDQLVRSVPSVQLFRRSDSRSANPTSQGVTARGLGGNAASRMLVLLDGVPQNDPFGGWLLWSALDPAGLAEVRIARGGGSVALGPGALAGTIELTSDRSAGLRGSLEGGADALDARFAAAGKGWNIAGWGGGDRGFVPIVASARGPADRRAPFAFAGLRASLVSGAFSVGAAAFADRRDRGLAFTDNDSRGFDGWLRWTAGKAATITLFHQQRRLDADFASANADRSLATPTLRQRVPAEATGWSAEVRRGIWRLGSDGRVADGRSDEQASFVAGSFTRDRRASGRQATAGAFVEANAEVGPTLLTAAARLDRWWIDDLRLVERSRATGLATLQESGRDRTGWAPTARLGLRTPVAAGVALRANAALGWRLPTLNELVRPFRVGRDAVGPNFALEPERLRGIEAGLDVSGAAWRATLTTFANRLSHPIANVTRGVGPGVFPGVGFVAGTYRQRDNLSAIDSRGVEADLRWSRGDWRAGGAVAAVDARVRDSGPLEGRRPAQVPAFTASADIGWRGIDVQLRHVGAQAEDDLGTLRLPAATTLDASATWPLGQGLALRLRGENLTGATVLAARSADGVDERATPRRLWLGLTLRR